MSRPIMPLILSTAALSLTLLLPPSSLAQRTGHSGGFGGGFSSGHSSGHIGGFSRGFSSGRISGSRGSVGSFRGGFSGQRGFRGGYGGLRGNYGGYGGYYSRGFYPRYGYYPGYYGYYGYPPFGLYASFGYGYWPYYDYWAPSYIYYPDYPQQVVIERGVVPYDAGDRRDEPPPTRPAAEQYWLVALKDDTTLAVTDYWLQDSTLNYVTRQGTKSTVEFSRVDLEFTRQLNRERGLEFQLPRPSAGYQPRRRDAYGRAY